MAERSSHRQGAFLAPATEFGLEQEPRVDVDHDLIGAGQVDVEQPQALVVRGAIEAGGDHDGFAEDAGRLGQAIGVRRCSGVRPASWLL